MLVDRLLGRQSRQGGTDLARGDRAFHEGHGVLAVDQPRRVPVLVERLGVYLPEEEVIGQTDHRSVARMSASAARSLPPAPARSIGMNSASARR